MVRTASRSSVNTSNARIKAQLLGWISEGVTLIKSRHLASKGVKGSLTPNVEKKISYTKRKVGSLSSVNLPI